MESRLVRHCLRDARPYVVLDGFDFGAGVVHRVVARTDDERRTVWRRSVPSGDGNEVWLIAAGASCHDLPTDLFHRVSALLPGTDDRAVAVILRGVGDWFPDPIRIIPVA